MSGLSGNASFCGLAWGDYNNDGFHDLYASYIDHRENILYHNNGDGTFSEVTDVAGVTGGAISTSGSSWGDFDNDSYLDLYLGNSGTNRLYHSNGDGTFTDVTFAAGVGNTEEARSPVWGDYDADGDLDVFVPSRYGPDALYRNEGDGTFTDVSTAAGISDTSAVSASWCDYDDDGDVDLYVCRHYRRNSLYQNDGKGGFVDVSSDAGVRFDGGSGVSWADYDNDGDFDLCVGRIGENHLCRNEGDGTFSDVTEASGVSNPRSTRSVVWGDYDADGDLDLYVGNHFSHTNALYRNEGNGTFTEVMDEVGIADVSGGQNAAWCDYDNDGDLDICFDYRATGVLYRNNGHSNNWLEINLVGSDCNTFGIGARVTVVAGDLLQVREVCAASGFCSQSSLTLEYGLADHSVVDSVGIRWPCGRMEVLKNLPADQIITVAEAAQFIRGDADSNMEVEMAYAFFTMCHLYLPGAEPPQCERSADSNDNGVIGMSDVMYTLRYLYVQDNPPPPAPYPDCGEEPTPDGLGCDWHPCMGEPGRPAVANSTRSGGRLSLGEPFVEATGVRVPVYLSSQRELSAFAYSVEYDEDILAVRSVENSGLVTEGFDFFSARTVGGRTAVGNVVAFSMEEGLLPGDYHVADIVVEFLAKGEERIDLGLSDGELVDREANPLSCLTAGVTLDRSLHLRLPRKFALGRAHPNPISDRTSIAYQLPRETYVSLRVYNAAGQLVRNLVEDVLSGGYYRVDWDGRNHVGSRVSAGVYFCKLEAEEYTETRKLVVLE
jgi:hypothetical protein